MYTEEMLESIKKVEAAREANAALEPRRMTAGKGRTPGNLSSGLSG